MAKYNKPVFVNEQIGNPKVKIASKFIAYKSWDDPSLWLAEVINNGSAFFHWRQGDRAHGHKDSNYQLHRRHGGKAVSAAGKDNRRDMGCPVPA